jgi:uncharacterized membrane protein
MIFVLMYVLFGAMFFGGSIFYWVSSRPFQWADDFQRAAEGR